MKKIVMMIGLCLIFCSLARDAYAAEPIEVWQYGKNIEQAAEPFTVQIIQAINNEDYNSLQKNLSVKMKEVFPESSFKKMTSELKEKYGDYKEKEVMNIELRGQYIIVNYKGVFSKMANPVLIRVILMKENGKTCICGLWLNQMECVKKSL